MERSEVGRRRLRAPWAATSAVCLALAALAAFAAAGWPGAPNPCLAQDACYCEAFRAGPVRQPANTASALAFVAVGLALAARASSRRAAAFAGLIALIGPGTMALHASMTAWGGNLDSISMYLLVSFAGLHDAGRLWPAARPWFWRTYAALNAALAATKPFDPVPAELVFGSLVGLLVLAELALAARDRRDGRDRRWLLASAAGFAAGLACWVPSRLPSGWLCRDPRSWLQGHAAWHVLSALAAGALYLYLEPELEALSAEDAAELRPAAIPGLTRTS